MSTEIENEYNRIFNGVQGNLLKDDSLYNSQIEKVKKIMKDFGLTHLEESKLMAEFLLNFINQGNSASISTSIELMKLNDERIKQNKNLLKLDAEILNIKARTIAELSQSALTNEKTKNEKENTKVTHEKIALTINQAAKEKAGELAEKENTKVISQKIVYTKNQALVEKEKIDSVRQDTNMMKLKQTTQIKITETERLKGLNLIAQTGETVKKMNVENQKELLLKNQTASEASQKTLIEKQAGLVKRQTRGYDDNMLVKAAEFQGSLASFAVNADSDSAQGAINNFNGTVSQVKGRA